MTAEPGINVEDTVRGWTVRHVESTGSTNADVMALVGRGAAPDRLVLRSDHQTAGRGRLDRRWDAPPGSNLLCSMLFLLPGPRPHEIVQRVGLAAVHAVERASGGSVDGLGLKWPNDLLWQDRKLAGLLAQRTTGPAAGSDAVVDGVVVGLGLNVRWCPEGATSVEQIVEAAGGSCPNPQELLGDVLRSFDRLPEAAEALAARYRDRLLTLGRAVRIERPGGSLLRGVAVDVDAAGRLVLDGDDGRRHVVDVGDIVHATAE